MKKIFVRTLNSSEEEESHCHQTGNPTDPKFEEKLENHPREGMREEESKKTKKGREKTHEKEWEMVMGKLLVNSHSKWNWKWN